MPERVSRNQSEHQYPPTSLPESLVFATSKLATASRTSVLTAGENGTKAAFCQVPRSYIVPANLARRNLTKSQQAMAW
jgi:hypothetical protein